MFGFPKNEWSDEDLANAVRKHIESGWSLIGASEALAALEELRARAARTTAVLLLERRAAVCWLRGAAPAFGAGADPGAAVRLLADAISAGVHQPAYTLPVIKE